MWFKNLTGFDENIDDVYSKLNVKNNTYPLLISLVNKKTYRCGSFSLPTLERLKHGIELFIEDNKSDLIVDEIVSDITNLYLDKSNEHALFQVASQFNVLEMASDEYTPEMGVDIYEHDYTQGAKSAIACGAGTIYRNYFIDINNKMGQLYGNQINCLELLENELNNKENKFWYIKNGYCHLTKKGIDELNIVLRHFSYEKRELLKEKIKYGVGWNSQVTLNNSNHLVNQIFCSALPIPYFSNIRDIEPWEEISKLVLEAAYEATLNAAVLNTKSNKVFLTLLGGGVFNNKLEWILDSMKIALNKFRHIPLDVKIVSYPVSNNKIKLFIEELWK